MVADSVVNDALNFAHLAAEIANQFFRKPVQVSFKPDHSPVTEADQTIERRVRAAILAKYPDHGIFGEEYGIAEGAHKEMWVIDPIDGTRSFLSGHPLYGFLLAYLESDDPQFGIIAIPEVNEIYCGIKGRNATLNGEDIHVSRKTRLEDAILYVNEGDKIHSDHPGVFDSLMKTGQTRRFSYDCYPHALLAAGHVDAVVDYDLKPYDFLALGVVVEAAGGIMTTWKGAKPDLGYEGPVVSAASVELHSQLIDQLNLEN